MKIAVKLDMGLTITPAIDTITLKSKDTAGKQESADPIANPSEPKAVAATVKKQVQEILTVQPVSKRSDPSVEKRAILLRDIESLRFGIVPHGRIDRLTMGYENILQWVKKRLDDKPSVSEVCGAFGTGKSHTMSLVRHIGRNLNYLTAKVEIDGHDVALSNPAGLSKALWPTLEHESFRSTTPIIDLSIRAIEKGSNGIKIQSKTARPDPKERSEERCDQNFKVTKLLHARETLDEVSCDLDGLLTSADEYSVTEIQRKIKDGNLLGGHQFELKPPLGRLVRDRPRGFVETLLAYTSLATEAGFEGLIVTIDEFEIEQQQNKSQIQKTTDLVVFLAEYFLGGSQYRELPLSIFFATIAESDEKGDKLIRTIFLEDNDNQRYQLSGLQEKDLIDLARLIFETYSEAYLIKAEFDKDTAKRTVEHVKANAAGGLSVVREFIKAWLYTLDGLYPPLPQ
ncbi:MAG: DUF2791 family P-loop domain-containing protein [Candidatus Obscuribacterales bacterium]|nr:DUF2791 family P-loop domain-containing protein [Candidatus Obscuribacterales bacterium]